MKYFSILLLFFLIVFVSCSKDDELPPRDYINSIISPNVGGANEPNMVFVDLGTATTKEAKRDSWDLSFYCGNKFRVQINTSIYAAVGQFKFSDNSTTTNLSDVTTQTAGNLLNVIAFGTADPTNIEYVDDFDGDINNTAIDEISLIPEENKVYLFNMGFEVPNSQPITGSVEVAGNHRGWKKIRILREDEHYILQYANLDDTTYKEVIINKNTEYNSIFYSFNSESEVLVEPKKNMWDLCFTVFENQIVSHGTYGYADFVLTNSKQNVQSYQVKLENNNPSFENFNETNIDNSLFNVSQRTIGSNWRQGGGPGTQPTMYSDRYYIVKDVDGQIYKLKFVALTDNSGVRGFPIFHFLPVD